MISCCIVFSGYLTASAYSIIESVMALFGINGQPATALDLLWDVVILVVGFFIVKYVMLFVISLMREMLKIH